MNNSENLMLKDSLKDLVRDGSLTAKDIDVLERDITLGASKLWDQICWELDASKKAELTAQWQQANENLKAVYAARAELYAR
jgi:hypothetical protein